MSVVPKGLAKLVAHPLTSSKLRQSTGHVEWASLKALEEYLKGRRDVIRLEGSVIPDLL